MYTVLIQAKSTYENYLHFNPLMAAAVEDGRIGVCQWVESGTSIETAVPGLYDLIEKKNIWRAIIVQTDLDDNDEKYPTASNNPYDFLENAGRTGLTVENGTLLDCEAPLIRLTHLLGGMPAPELQFEEVIEYDSKIGPDAVPRIVFNTVGDEKGRGSVKEAYQKWVDSHTLQGPPPVEIILVTAKKTREDVSYADINNSWQMHTEAQSSTFWRRNLYPHNCRFLVYDLDTHGRMRRERDCFLLWTAILLLATNDADPDVLQAHRLYSLKLTISQEKLKDTFQETVDRLNKAQYLLKKSLIEEEKKDFDVITELPDYAIGVPVGFELPKASEIQFDQSKFALLGGEESDDLEEWSDYTIRANDELKIMLRSADRYLDQAADRLRRQSKYYETEVYKLSPYQEEDMSLELANDYENVLKRQSELPTGASEVKERAEKLDSEVRGLLKRRISGRQNIFVIAVPTVLLAVCLAIGIVPGEPMLWYPIILTASAIALGLSTLFILLAQRRALLAKVSQYQQALQNVTSELNRNAGAFSRFLSGIASHIRGKSYLDIMHEKQEKRDSTHYYKLKHIKAIEAQLSKISVWSFALQAEVDMSSSHALGNYDEDPEMDYDGIYYLAAEEKYSVPLNRTGVELKSPFDFVQRIEIEREEIYDDVE